MIILTPFKPGVDLSPLVAYIWIDALDSQDVSASFAAKELLDSAAVIVFTRDYSGNAHIGVDSDEKTIANAIGYSESIAYINALSRANTKDTWPNIVSRLNIAFSGNSASNTSDETASKIASQKIAFNDMVMNASAISANLLAAEQKIAKEANDALSLTTKRRKEEEEEEEQDNNFNKEDS